MDERFNPWYYPYVVEEVFELLDEIEVHMSAIDDVNYTTLILLLPEVDIR